MHIGTCRGRGFGVTGSTPWIDPPRQGPLAGSWVPVVAASADAVPSTEKRLLGAGARGFLPEPIDVRELVSTIDRFSGRQGPATGETEAESSEAATARDGDS